MMIQIPTSYRDYLHNRTIQSVVDHLLQQRDNKLPQNIEWNEVRAYHQAYLSARKVKTDRALFLMDLWDAIWKPALDKFGVSEQNAWSIADMKNEEAEPSAANMWDTQDGYHRWFTASLSGHPFNIYTQLCIKSKEAGVQLYFSADDESGQAYCADLTLSNGWSQRPDEYYNRYTQAGLLSIDAHTPAIDIYRLAELAAEIIPSTLNEIIKATTTNESD